MMCNLYLGLFMKNDWTSEDITAKKMIGVIVCIVILFVIGHYMSCEWKGGAERNPRSCKVVTSIINFVTSMK